MLREVGDVGGAVEEGEALGGGDFVVSGEEAVGVADQDATVLVIDPRRGGLVVNAGHDALRDEEPAEADVRQLVVGCEALFL